MKLIARVRERFTHKDQAKFVIPMKGAYFNLDGFSRNVNRAIEVLEEDHANLLIALKESDGLRVTYRSKFHNHTEQFCGPGKVRERLAENERALNTFREVLNICQEVPHPDFALLTQRLSEFQTVA